VVDLTISESEYVAPAPSPFGADLIPGAVAREPEPAERTWADRCLWTMVGFGLLVWGSQLIALASYEWTIVLLVLCNIWGLGTVIAAWIPDNRFTTNPRVTNSLAWITAVLTTGVVLGWGLASLKAGPFYGTDEIAFNQYAAQLVRHGLNPYTHSMAPAFQLFHTPSNYYTYSFSGKPITALSYPTLSFLVYVPFLLLGWSYNLAPSICIIVWVLSALIMFALLPSRSRPIALLFGGASLYAAYSLGGVTDCMYLPMMLLAAYKWDKFGSSRLSYLGPVMFGLAMSVKQTPWVALPFMLAALACDEYARAGLKSAVQRVARYLAVVLVVFLIPNLPWIIAAPRAWLKGTFTPFFAHMVPTGQGTISLSLYLHLGGGSVTAFTLATVFAMVLLLVSFVGTYPLLRVALFVLPSFVFLFGARSNVNYFISMLPVAFVAAATASPPEVQRLGPKVFGPAGFFRSRRWAIAIGASTLLFAAAVVRSLTASAPISIQIAAIETTGNTNHIDQLTLRVTNHTSGYVTPAFDTMADEYNSTFWKIDSGPSHLAPHHTAQYVILSQDAVTNPSIYSQFNVVGYTSGPDTFSVSPGYDEHLYNVSFNPDVIDHTIASGSTTRIGVQLYNSHGVEVHKRGVQIRLNAIVWGPTGPGKAYVRLDGGPVGYRHYGYTNSSGEAFFNVVGTQPTGSSPVSLTAFLWNPQFKFVYGITGDLNLRFTAH
jgi:hypothetical protein